MLVDKLVKVQIGNKNKNHFIGLGYDIRNTGIEIEVRPQDLMTGSNVLVDAICDFCDKTRTIRYKGYIQTINSNYGKYRCRECSTDHHRCDIEKVRRHYREMGVEPILTEYKDQLQRIYFVCPIHPDEEQFISYSNLKTIYRRGDRPVCRVCNLKHRYEAISGEKHHNYKHGLTPLVNHLRKASYDWLNESLAHYQYRCALTGAKRDLEVHHLTKSFGEILTEVSAELGVKNLLQQVKDYDPELIRNLFKRVKEKHDELSLGVPLRKDLHAKFHSRYGKEHSRKEDFAEFVRLFVRGQI